MARGNASVRRVGVYGSNRFDSRGPGGAATVNATVSFSGTGALSSTAVRILAEAVSYNGAGTLVSTARVTRIATASYTGTGTFSSAALVYKVASVSYAGAGTLSSAPGVIRRRSASYSGTGTLSTSSRLILAEAVAYAGSGTLSSTAQRIQVATAAYTGTGTFSATRTLAIAQALSGVLTMAGNTATLNRRPLAITSTLVMSGDVVRSALVSFVSLSGVLTGTGTLTAALRISQVILGTLTGSAVLGTTYVPPSPGGDDGLTTRLRRNQTD